MKKIITLIALCSPMAAYSADIASVEGNYGLISDSEYQLGSNYSVTSGLRSNTLSNYNSTLGASDPYNVWVGVAGKYGELRAGGHDSLDTLSISSADQQNLDGAYDLLIQDDVRLSKSLTYVAKSGGLSVAAQVATDEDSETENTSTGLSLNAQSKSLEAAVVYRRTLDESKAVKGRLTYKSRNNSRVRVDLVAEKVDRDADASAELADSTSLMLGASYKMTRKSYLAGQYGVVGFGESDFALAESDADDEHKDYNALSLEAGYSLSDNTSVYINHTQKSFDSGLQMPFSEDLQGSQTNSIGVRLNW